MVHCLEPNEGGIGRWSKWNEGKCERNVVRKVMMLFQSGILLSPHLIFLKEGPSFQCFPFFPSLNFDFSNSNRFLCKNHIHGDSSHSQELQLTLAILKPDIMANFNQSRQIIQTIIDSQLYIIRSKELKLSKSDAEKFYEAHRGKKPNEINKIQFHLFAGRFFYSRLIHFMSSGPLMANILAGHNAIERWRKLMGPTKVFKAIHEDPDSIRAKYGITDTRNVTHGSDSPESAEKEIKFFFPEFDFETWKSKESEHFQKEDVIFCNYENVHKIKTI